MTLNVVGPKSIYCDEVVTIVESIGDVKVKTPKVEHKPVVFTMADGSNAIALLAGRRDGVYEAFQGGYMNGFMNPHALTNSRDLLGRMIHDLRTHNKSKLEVTFVHPDTDTILLVRCDPSEDALTSTHFKLSTPGVVMTGLTDDAALFRRICDGVGSTLYEDPMCTYAVGALLNIPDLGNTYTRLCLKTGSKHTGQCTLELLEEVLPRIYKEDAYFRRWLQPVHRKVKSGEINFSTTPVVQVPESVKVITRK